MEKSVLRTIVTIKGMILDCDVLSQCVCARDEIVMMMGMIIKMILDYHTVCVPCHTE